MSDEKIRLVLETLGVDNVRQATKVLKEMEAVVDDLGDQIESGLVKANGALILSLKDGRRIAADTAEGFQKLKEQQGRFFVSMSDGTKSLIDADDAMRAAANAAALYEERLRSTKKSVNNLHDAHVQLHKTQKQYVGPVMDSHVVAHKKHQEELGKSEKATAMFGRRMMEASYMIDDVQYGFHGIVNNIPRFAQAFNISAAAVGLIGIAAVGVNQAFKLMNSMFGDAEIKVKPLGEAVGDFAKGLGASAVEAERLTAEVKKLSTQSMAGWTTGLTENLGKIREAIQAQKEIVALQKESQEAAEKRDAFEKRVAEAGKIKDKGGQLGDVLEGGGADGMIGLAQKLAPDKIGKARGQLMDEQLAAMEAAGNFGDIRDPLFGIAVPFLNRGGTSLTKNRAEERAAARRADAKRKLEMNMTFDSDETRKKAESIAGETIERAVAGDPQAIAEIEAISPEFADLIKWDTEDKAFQGGLEGRSRQVASRDAARAKARAASMEMASNPKIDPLLLLDRREEVQRANEMQPSRFTLQQEETRKAIEANAAAEEAKARNQAIRDQITAQFDPTQIAARRVQMAGMGPGAKRRLAFLEKQDLSTMTGMMDEAGMAPGEARTAARETLVGGKNQLADLAKQQSENTGRAVSLMETSNMLLNQVMEEAMAQKRRLDMLEQGRTVDLQGMQAPARPQNGHARN